MKKATKARKTADRKLPKKVKSTTLLDLPSIEKLVVWWHNRFSDRAIRTDELILIAQSDGVIHENINAKLLLEILKANVKYTTSGEYQGQFGIYKLVWTGLAGWWRITTPESRKGKRLAFWDGDPDTFVDWFRRTFRKTAANYDTIMGAALLNNPRTKDMVTERQFKRMLDDLVDDGIMRVNKKLNRYRIVSEED